MATPRWVGDAVDVAQVDTILISGTWTAADEITLTINGKDIVIVLGATVTTAAIATAIKEVWNGDTLTGDATSSTTGNLIPEFNESTATVDSSTVTITGDTKGVPFTLTMVDDGAGTFTHTADGTGASVVATGKNHFDNADNWSTGSVPVDDDTIVFDHGDVFVKYGLDQSAVTPAAVNITSAYTGEIGLPETNADDTTSTYHEYRSQYLSLGVNTDAATTTFTIGSGTGQGSGRIKLNSGDSQAVFNVQAVGSRAETGVPAILWKGTHTANIANITKGDVGIATIDGEATTLATLRVGYDTNVESDVLLEVGSGITLGVLDVSGGVTTIESGTAAITTATVSGGTVNYGGDQGITALDIYGGVLNYTSTGTITTISSVSNGVFSRAGEMQAAIITDIIQIFTGASFLDQFGVLALTNGFRLKNCKVDDVTLDLGPNRAFTVT